MKFKYGSMEDIILFKGVIRAIYHKISTFSQLQSCNKKIFIFLMAKFYNKISYNFDEELFSYHNYIIQRLYVKIITSCGETLSRRYAFLPIFVSGSVGSGPGLKLFNP